MLLSGKTHAKDVWGSLTEIRIGLTWDDMDFKSKELNIDFFKVLKSPKNKALRRF